MRLLDRYIGTTVGLSVLGALLVLVGLDTFIDFIAEIDEIGRGRYTLSEAFLFILFTMPRRVYQLFPIAAALGSVIGLGVLASSNELTVVRAAGVSTGKIVVSVMKVGALLMLVVILVGEFVAPYSEPYARDRRAIALANQITLKTEHGLWLRNDSSFVNIRRVNPGGDIGDIYIYEFDQDHRLRVATHAKRAVYQDGRWNLRGIARTRIEDDGVTSETAAGAEWESLLSPDLIGLVLIKPDMLSVWNLRRYIRYLRDNGQSAAVFEAVFWVKAFAPVATGVMVFLAVPFVFGPLRSGGVGHRILVGAMVGIAFHIVNQVSSQMGLAYGFNPLLSALLPSVLFTVFGLLLLRRAA